MEKLWSPWRSQYIESFKNPDENGKCIFCSADVQNIADENCLKFYEGELCYAVLNLYPYNNGHLMVVPRRHVSGFNELTKEELNEAMSIIQKSIEALTELMKPQGFNMGANIGKAAGAGIDTHLHFHLVPRWNGDTNFMPVLGEVKVISQDLLATKKNLVEFFSGTNK